MFKKEFNLLKLFGLTWIKRVIKFHILRSTGIEKTFLLTSLVYFSFWKCKVERELRKQTALILIDAVI